MPKLSDLSIPELEKALTQKKDQHDTLQKKRGRLAAELQSVKNEIAALTSGVREKVEPPKVAKAPSKPKNKARVKTAKADGKTLREIVYYVLSGRKRPMSLQNITDAALDAGYRTQSKDPAKVVRVLLYTDKNVRTATPGRFLLKSKRKK